MFAAYVTLTVIAAVFAGSAALTYLIDHAYPRAQLEMKRLPVTWMPRLGAVLAAGAIGLPAGFAWPAVGALAASGLVLYFVGAFIAHTRVGSRQLIGPAVFLAVNVATLVVNLTYHHGLR